MQDHERNGLICLQIAFKNMLILQQLQKLIVLFMSLLSLQVKVQGHAHSVTLIGPHFS